MSFLATALGMKVVIGALSLVVVGGGIAVAAATGGLQNLQSVGATATPTGRATASPSSLPTRGPDATGPAAFGLCTAFKAGGLSSGSVAYTALLSAAQASGSIGAYCSPILSSHGSPSKGPKPTQTGSTTGQSHGHGSVHPATVAPLSPGS